MTKPNLPLRTLAAATVLCLTAHANAAPEGDKGICAFIQQEDAHLAAQVEGRTGAPPDRFIGKGGKGSTYRYDARDARIDYRVTADGRPWVVSSVMERRHIAARGWTHDSVAQQLNLPQPLPARLELTCEHRTLYVASAAGRIESLSLEARAD
ncbi:hypothetical protein HHL21_15555 [Massilia sp. RP-1-19]|uniref:Uncharacterized protein n=1 Tax=Massilia polaris TaxID=2728846 RepID=A0A848HML9_9BURK|nr:hypothetical protein [Massilia polaris]NML62464.1 hypothetical protein [Massilia polaris]